MINLSTNLTEEYVTRKLARTLASEGHEIIAVHPPDGQGPFVIPKVSMIDDIERSSYHPDIVSIGAAKDGKLILFISECKLEESDLGSDRTKLEEFASSADSLLYAFFRCQLFAEGPEKGFDFEQISRMPKNEYPIHFILAAGSEHETTTVAEPKIDEFPCTKYLFDLASLSK